MAAAVGEQTRSSKGIVRGRRRGQMARGIGLNKEVSQSGNEATDG